MVTAVETICVLAGLVPLAFGFAQYNLLPMAIGCSVIGLLWLAAFWRHWTWAASLGLLVFVGAAGLGVWIGLPPIMMGFSVLASLSAWDLAHFSLRLSKAAPEDDLRKIRNHHLLRLAGQGALGLVLILAAVLLQLKITFGWLFLLAILAVIGVMQLADRIRQAG